MSLTNTTRSETTKQFTTSMWWILAIVLVAYVAFTAAVLGFVFSASATGSLPGDDGPQLPAEGLPAMLYSTATAIGYVFPLLIGTLMVTTEFRHKTLTPTFLATPRRGVVLWAKIVVGILLGALYGVVGVVAAVVPAAGLPGRLRPRHRAHLRRTPGRCSDGCCSPTSSGCSSASASVRSCATRSARSSACSCSPSSSSRSAGPPHPSSTGSRTSRSILPGAASDALVGASVFSASMAATGDGPQQLEWWAGGARAARLRRGARGARATSSAGAATSADGAAPGEAGPARAAPASSSGSRRSRRRSRRHRPPRRRTSRRSACTRARPWRVVRMTRWNSGCPSRSITTPARWRRMIAKSSPPAERHVPIATTPRRCVPGLGTPRSHVHASSVSCTFAIVDAFDRRHSPCGMRARAPCPTARSRAASSRAAGSPCV